MSPILTFKVENNSYPDLYMVITMKKTGLFLLVLLLMIGVCGCGMKGQDKVNAMVSYINDKYADDSFEYVSMSGGHLGSNTTKIIVKSEKFPDKKIRVICRETNGERVYSDTYLNIKFEEQTRAYIEGALTGAFGTNVYVQYIPDDTGSMKKGSADTLFPEFISDSTTYVYFNAVVVSDLIDEVEAMDKIKAAFSDGVVLGNVYFVDSSYSGSVGNDAMSLVEEKKYHKTVFFMKSSVDQYKSIEWKDGV